MSEDPPAKRREIRMLKLKEEYMAFRRHRLSSLEPDPNISRTEEKRKDSAKEREIRTLKLMEEYMAFRRQIVSPLEPDPNISSEVPQPPEPPAVPFTCLSTLHLCRTEEKREDPAKRREIMESMEESIAFIRQRLSPPDHGPNIASRTEEETEESRAKRRVLRKLESMEESIALIREDLLSCGLGPFFSSPEKMREDSPASSCVSMMSARSMDFPFSFKQWQRLLDYLRTFSMLSRYKSNPEKMREGSPASSSGSTKSARSMDFPFSFKRAEEEREDSPALEREIRKIEQEHLALRRRQRPLDYLPTHLSMLSSPEKMREGSPASSSGSMMSARSMDFPFSFKQWQRLLDYLRTFSMLYSQRRYKSNPEKMRADSPSSCGSTKSARSMDFPFSFKRSEEEREDYPALEREIRKIQWNLWSHDHGPFSPSERSFGSSTEEERAGSPTPSCESMMSDGSMFLSSEIQG
ncbi:uncharacterized protein LOC117496457 [Trematomus bernacchii]|uniref:uncharacterized protein LOC117496457 n=1 Tax=Trematomus bernacchii TaxID=40690 RepID=UPI00146B53BF|nr:uncharacterized protein LOC117496457 [Trematomus bernacchii]XP_034004024.1 uncharacterized protein LOC117496457 [Trematomus bernacchii]